MNNHEILKNAPEGAEYHSVIGYLWNDGEDWFVFMYTEWVNMFFYEYPCEFKISSLADIQEIEDLKEQLANTKKAKTRVINNV